MYNIRLSWNFIYGFPGEKIEEFDWFLEVFRNIVHLRPPDFLSNIRLDKFSPNYNKAKEKGIVNIKPLESYYHVFKESEEKIDDVAFYYSFDYEDGRTPLEYSRKLYQFWQEWLYCKDPGKLYLNANADSSYHIVDTRFTKTKANYPLHKNEALLYIYCDSPRSKNQIVKTGKTMNITENKIMKFLDKMEERGFMSEQNSKYVSLAIISDQIMYNF